MNLKKNYFMKPTFPVLLLVFLISINLGLGNASNKGSEESSDRAVDQGVLSTEDVEAVKQRAKIAKHKSSIQKEDATTADIRQNIVKAVQSFNKGQDPSETIKKIQILLEGNQVFSRYVINNIAINENSAVLFKNLISDPKTGSVTRNIAVLRIRNSLAEYPVLKETLIVLLNKKSEEASVRESIALSLAHSIDRQSVDAVVEYMTESEQNSIFISQYFKKNLPDSYSYMIAFLRKSDIEEHKQLLSRILSLK